MSCAVLDIRVWTGGEGTLKTCQLACLRLCPLLSLQQVHRPVQATVGRDELGLMTFLDSSHTHTGALLARHMADVRDSFTVSLPVLHVLPDVSMRKGSVLICSDRRIPYPPIRSLLCCVAAVAGRRQVSASSCIIRQKGYRKVFWYCVLATKPAVISSPGLCGLLEFAGT